MLIVFTFFSESERDKFEYLYQHYKKLLLHKAYAILQNYSLAEDAVSEAYIRIYKNLHKIGDPAANQSIAFVVTITKNVALSMLNKEKAQPYEEYGETCAADINVEENVLDNLLAQDIYAMVNSLSQDLQSVFVLKYAYDYSHREIGGLLGISENNVTVRLHRAKKKLADILVKEGYK